MREGRRGRLQKYCPYGRGKQGQTIVLSLCGMGEGADYRSTVPMGEGGGQIYYGSFHGGWGGVRGWWCGSITRRREETGSNAPMGGGGRGAGNGGVVMTAGYWGYGWVPGESPLYWGCGWGGCRCRAAGPATCAGYPPTVARAATATWAGCGSWGGPRCPPGPPPHTSPPASPPTTTGVTAAPSRPAPIWPRYSTPQRCSRHLSSPTPSPQQNHAALFSLQLFPAMSVYAWGKTLPRERREWTAGPSLRRNCSIFALLMNLLH